MTERERRLFLTTFLVLAAAQVVPIWAVRFQPVPDLPTHLAASAIWFHYDDPKWDFARYYGLQLGLTPYWGYYLLVHLLAFPFGVEGANRVVLSLVVVGLPAGMALVARRFGRSPWLALFAFPLAWNKSFSLGFVTFAVALTFLPFAVAAFDFFCEKPSWRRAALAAAAGTAVFFSHFLPWTMYLGCAGLVGLCHEGLTRKSFAQRLGVWAVPAAAGALVMRGGHGYHMGTFNHGVAFAWRSALDQLHGMPEWLIDLFKGREDEFIGVALILCWIALQFLARRQRPRLHDLRAEACFLVGAVGYLFGPRSLLRPVYWWGINVRFAPLAMLFLALCVQGAIEGRRRFIFAPVAALALAFAVAVTVHWRRVDSYVIAGFDQLSKRPAPGERVMVLAFPPWNEPSMQTNFAQSADAFHQASYGGYEPDQYDDGFPIVYTQRFPAPPWNQPNLFNWDRHARYYDWLLVYQAPRNLVAGRPAELVEKVGRWSLWHLPPRIDAPPGPAYPSEWAFDPNWRPPQ
jgi:hypothetical protein